MVKAEGRTFRQPTEIFDHHWQGNLKYRVDDSERGYLSSAALKSIFFKEKYRQSPILGPAWVFFTPVTPRHNCDFLIFVVPYF